MNITYNIDKLKEIVDDMCALTGVAMAIADTKRNFLYFNLEESNEFCSFVQSDILIALVSELANSGIAGSHLTDTH